MLIEQLCTKRALSQLWTSGKSPRLLVKSAAFLFVFGSFATFSDSTLLAQTSTGAGFAARDRALADEELGNQNSLGDTQNPQLLTPTSPFLTTPGDPNALSLGALDPGLPLNDPAARVETNPRPTAQGDFGAFGGLPGSGGTGLTLTLDPGLPIVGSDLSSSLGTRQSRSGVSSSQSDDDASVNARGEIERSPVDRLPQRALNPVDRLVEDPIDRSLPTGSINGATGGIEAVSQKAEPVGPVPNVDTDQETTDPFAATGLRLGTFNLFPTLETSIGYTTNADNAAGSTGTAYSRVAPALNLQSDWARHALTATASGTFDTQFNSNDLIDVTASLAATGRLDVTDVDRLEGSFSYVFSQEDSSEQGNGITVLGTDNHSIAGGLAYERDAGIIGLRLATNVTYDVYEGGQTVGGTVFTTSSDRTNLFVRPSARVSLNPGAVIEPYVEVGGRKRLYKNAPDSTGVNRNATGYDILAGVELDGGDLISGEISAGFVHERAEDASLADLNAFTLNGTATYSPSDILTINGSLSTNVASTTLAGSAASINYAAAVDATYALRDNLDLNARMSGTYLTYSGPAANTYGASVGIGALYRVNRLMQVYGNYDYSISESSGAGSSYDDHTVEMGLRLQR